MTTFILSLIMLLAFFIIKMYFVIVGLKSDNKWHEKWFGEYNVRISKLEPPKESDGYFVYSVIHAENGDIKFVPLEREDK